MGRRSLPFWFAVKSYSFTIKIRAILLVAAIIAGAVRMPAGMAAETETPAVAARIPPPEKDDADLHDVRFITQDAGWAVGDHGTVWSTRDGGRNWEWVPCPADCALRSVCFLNNRSGWVAGGTTMPFTRVGLGVVLATKDGGRTWNDLARGKLPQAHFVRFFTPRYGVLVVEANAEFSSGVLTTTDGGTTWNALPADWHPGWRAADFSSPDSGVLAGLEGTVAHVEGKLSDARASGYGARALHDVKLLGNDGWVVGDGGLILHTTDHGVIWKGPPIPLPAEAGDIFDFLTIATRGEKLWIAGSPGSVMWHSPDGGATWQRQRTGQAAPIERIAFQSDTLGFAVGAFGAILRTEDGGATWQAVRAGGRRAAILTIVARADEISFNVVAKESVEGGYRNRVLLPLRNSEDGEGVRSQQLDLRLQDAVASALGGGGRCGWRFPLEIPGLDRDAEKLVAEWMRRTEHRFRPVFYGDLVCRIRTWRPTVVLVRQPSLDDAAGNLLAGAVVEAVRQASDPESFPAHHDLAGLAPWETSRVFVRLPPESSGDLLIDVHRALPRLQSTIHTVATSAASRLRPIDFRAPETESFRMVLPARSGNGTDTANWSPGDFFSGIALAPGGAARRLLPPLDARAAEEARRQARLDRDFRAIARQKMTGATQGAEMIAMLDSSSRRTDRATGALQLAMLADGYRRNTQWDLAEATLAELIRQYPDQPAAWDGMQWLFQFWVGAEPTYQRLRQFHVEDVRRNFNPPPIRQIIEKALELSRTEPNERDPLASITVPDNMQTSRQSGRLNTGKGDLVALSAQQQNQSALRLAALIRKQSPALFETAAIQLPLTALLRRTGLKTLPGEKPDRPGAGVIPVAFAIGQQSDQKAIKCRSAAVRPRLDGLLSDGCWEEADEIPLSSTGSPLVGDAPRALVMLAHDAENLYFAMSVPREKGTPEEPAMTLGRTRDKDLSRFDRIALCLDVDRDFTTWYTIEIDQRGCVCDSCWGDAGWNPGIRVAAQSEAGRWRIEGTIPFRDLAPRAPRPGESWGLAVIRTIPAVRLESWVQPASPRPRPESFGVLRFE